jgi:hypothetical protein
VYLHTDSNLLDVTLAPLTTATPSRQSAKQEEVALTSQNVQPETLHTTTEHPFLTADRGFVAALDLHIGELVKRLDGSLGQVVALHVRSGSVVRYNLTVAQDHTFAVGADQWV